MYKYVITFIFDDGESFDVGGLYDTHTLALEEAALQIKTGYDPIEVRISSVPSPALYEEYNN